MKFFLHHFFVGFAFCFYSCIVMGGEGSNERMLLVSDDRKQSFSADSLSDINENEKKIKECLCDTDPQNFVKKIDVKALEGYLQNHEVSKEVIEELLSIAENKKGSRFYDVDWKAVGLRSFFTLTFGVGTFFTVYMNKTSVADANEIVAEYAKTCRHTRNTDLTWSDYSLFYMACLFGIEFVANIIGFYEDKELKQCKLKAIKRGLKNYTFPKREELE